MAKLTDWKPEDPQAWAAGGSRTAWRNLAVSVPALLSAFCIWMFWSVLRSEEHTSELQSR